MIITTSVILFTWVFIIGLRGILKNGDKLVDVFKNSLGLHPEDSSVLVLLLGILWPLWVLFLPFIILGWCLYKTTDTFSDKLSYGISKIIKRMAKKD